MKKNITIILILLSFCGYSQAIKEKKKITTYLIQYEEETEIDFGQYLKNVPSHMLSDIKNQIKVDFPDNKIRLKFDLITNKEKSIYKRQQKMNNSQGKRSFFNSIVDNRNEIIFKQFKDNLLIEQKDLLGNMFLITDTLSSIKNKWIIKEGISKPILGHNCKYAETTTRDSIKISAFFTPNIEISDSPNKYFGLPGLILSLELEDLQGDYKQLFIAQSIVEYKEDIKEPSKGKLVTREEYYEEIKKMTEAFKQ